MTIQELEEKLNSEKINGKKVERYILEEKRQKHDREDDFSTTFLVFATLEGEFSNNGYGKDWETAYADLVNGEFSKLDVQIVGKEVMV